MTLILFENTFVLPDFAEEYFQNRPNSELWLNSDKDKKEQALAFATVKINNLNFIGDKKVVSQKLEFPRNFEPELPLEIQYAVCEEAIYLLDNSIHFKNKQYGISSVSIGNSSVSYFEKDSKNGLLSPEALSFVSKWVMKNFDIR